MPVAFAFCRVLTTACAVHVPSAATLIYGRSSCPWNPQPRNVSFVGGYTIREREVGSLPDGRICRRSSAPTILRRTISVLPMGTVHNARNSTVASHKAISTIHDARAPRPPGTFLHSRRHPPRTQMFSVNDSPGQLHSPHSAGLFHWRVTGNPLLHHTDCVFAGTTDLASTLGSTALSSASNRLHPAKVIRYFDRTPRATW